VPARQLRLLPARRWPAGVEPCAPSPPVCRYGENPHQSAAFYTDLSLGEAGQGGVATAVQHHGKEMSYNNYLVGGPGGGRGGGALAPPAAEHR
jgi:hypothetical protein